MGKIKIIWSFAVCISLVCGLFTPIAVSQAASDSGSYKYTQIIQQLETINVSKLQRQYTSQSIPVDFTFNSLSFSWNDTARNKNDITLEVQFKSGQWSKWYSLEPTIDNKESVNSVFQNGFFITGPATEFKYRILLDKNSIDSAVKVNDLEFTVFNQKPDPFPRTKSNDSFLSQVDDSFLMASNSNFTSTGDLGIVTRKEWKADESLNVISKEVAEVDTETSSINEKFKDELKVIRTITKNAKGQTLKWPLEYPESVKKIIIHHTATSEEALVASAKNTEVIDYKQIVKNIQHYHAITRGWGDIGYNYIIDPQGTIYEGRYGEAVGAHAAGSNHGSLGIAVIGNYQEKEVPAEVLNSIVKLSANKARKFKIQPDGKSTFRGETDHNMLGHRDVTATSCPGENLYKLLPTIRKLTAAAVNEEKSNLDYEFSDVSDKYAEDLNRNESKKISIKLKNIGKKSWGDGTYLLLDDGSVNSTMLDIKKKEGIKLSIMKEKSVGPGKTATFEFFVNSKSTSGMSELAMTPIVKSGSVSTKIDHKIYLPVFVAEPIYTYELVKANLPPAYIKKGTKIDNVWVDLKNTGNVTWSKTQNAVDIGADNPRDRFSVFVTSKPFTRMAFLTQNEVKPGETGRFYFKIQAPAGPGFYSESFTPVVEGIKWMKDKKMKFETYVYANEYEASITNVTFSQEIKINQTVPIKMTLKNVGGTIWKKGNINLDVTTPTNVKVVKKEIQSKEVKPGDTINLTITVQPSALANDGNISIVPKLGTQKLLKQAKSLHYKITNKKNSNTPSVTTKTNTAKSNSTTAATADLSSEKIRVKIGFEGNPKIKNNIGMTAYEGKNKIATYNANNEVEVSYKNNKYQIRQGTSTRTLTNSPKFISKTGGIMEITNLERQTSWNASLNDNKFRGDLEVLWDDNKLVTVNELPVEDYLRGLAENGNDEHLEKIKALIVAARTYARYYMTEAEKFPGKPWHLDDDPNVSQKYLGYGYELRAPNAVVGVDATKGEVITYKGKLIKTPYYTQSAGRTLSAKEVWGWTDTPYLQSVQDTYCHATELKGHGVGMSACGARGLAEAGKSYIDILKYFYIGVDVGK